MSVSQAVLPSLSQPPLHAGLKSCTQAAQGLAQAKWQGIDQHRRDGNIAPKHRYQHGHSHKIRDCDECRAFAESKGDKTQAEMAQL